MKPLSDTLKIVACCIAILLLVMIALPRAHAEQAADPQTTLADILKTTALLMHFEAHPEFVMMTTAEMKADGCADANKCPMLVSVHPPGTEKIIVNSDFDLAGDLSAQGQLVHVIAMFIAEKNGGYSPDMACSRVMQIEAHAQVVQAAYMDLKAQEFQKTGRYVPPFRKMQVITWCTPDAVKGQF